MALRSGGSSNEGRSLFGCEHIGLVSPQHPLLRHRESVERDLGFERLVTTQDLLVMAVVTLKEKAPRKEVLKVLAEEAVERALRKLRGKYGFQSIQWRNRLKGFPRGNPFNMSVWDELLRAGVIQKHHISNVADGGINVIEDAEIRRQVIAFFDNATFGPHLRKAIDTLAKGN